MVIPTSKVKRHSPLRSITSVRTYKTSNFPGEAAALSLECGHTVYCKASQTPKERARYPECFRAAEEAGSEDDK
jgi:hypothetical protein